jgi:electron transport complex protein RnfE
MNAFTYELYLILGIFIPLIVTNCIVLGRADAFASKHNVPAAVWDGLMMGMGFSLVLVLLGALRELIGTGALFSNMHLLFGDIALHWKVELISNYRGFLVALLPPGAFMVLGLLLALKNIIDARMEAAAKAKKEKVAVGSKRVRTTGNIA